MTSDTQSVAVRGNVNFFLLVELVLFMAAYFIKLVMPTRYPGRYATRRNKCGVEAFCGHSVRNGQATMNSGFSGGVTHIFLRSGKWLV